GAVLLFADDRLDLLEHPQAERQPAVDARTGLPDHPGAQHQPVRDDLRLARILAQQREKIFREPHLTSSRAPAAHSRQDTGACPLVPPADSAANQQRGLSLKLNYFFLLCRSVVDEICIIMLKNDVTVAAASPKI